MCNQYNGYENYQTWVVSLWMSNDYGTYQHYVALRDELLDQEDGDKEEATRLFADAIKNDHEENSPTADDANVYADLMGNALQMVNWYEIAENWFED